MVYAGYAPAKLPTELSPFQLALKGVENMNTLEIIGKLVYNSACAPTEDKYKTIKTTNKKIKEAVIDAPGGMEVLRQLGWVEADDGEALTCTRPMTMAQFRDIEAAKDNLRKDMRREEVAKLRAGSN